VRSIEAGRLDLWAARKHLRAFNSGYECGEPRTRSPRVVRLTVAERGYVVTTERHPMAVNRGIVFTTIRKENGVSPVCE
jgi:hypothetical protein